jgi:hypothetical protein
MNLIWLAIQFTSRSTWAVLLLSMLRTCWNSYKQFLLGFIEHVRDLSRSKTHKAVFYSVPTAFGPWDPSKYAILERNYIFRVCGDSLVASLPLTETSGSGRVPTEHPVPNSLIPNTTWVTLGTWTIWRHDRGIDIVRGCDASSFVETLISPLLIGCFYGHWMDPLWIIQPHYSKIVREETVGQGFAE